MGAPVGGALWGGGARRTASGVVLIGSLDVIDVLLWDSLAGIGGVSRTTTSSPASLGVTAVLSRLAAAVASRRLQLLSSQSPLHSGLERPPSRVFSLFDIAALGRDPDG
jgi:hypothetical protein